MNPSTTQHTKYPNIFSLGDASSMPNSKTAAAISAQAPVLVDNLRAQMDGEELKASYGAFLVSLGAGEQALTTSAFANRWIRFLVRSFFVSPSPPLLPLTLERPTAPS